MLTKQSMTGFADWSLQEARSVLDDKMKSSWALMGGERNVWSWVGKDG